MLTIILFISFISLLSFNSFGQITLQDILDVKDKRTFQRLMIENNFQEETNPEIADVVISYRKWLNDNSLNSFSWRITDSVGLGGVMGYFSENALGKNRIYDAIYDEVKKGCTFMDITNQSSTGKSVAYYNCPDANADPRLVELDNKIKKDYPEVWDNGYRATDVQIGFTKSEDLFVIEYPMPEYEVEEMIEITKMMLEIYKQQKE